MAAGAFARRECADMNFPSKNFVDRFFDRLTHKPIMRENARDDILKRIKHIPFENSSLLIDAMEAAIRDNTIYSDVWGIG
jgi:hypothetical protein